MASKIYTLTSTQQIAVNLSLVVVKKADCKTEAYTITLTDLTQIIFKLWSILTLLQTIKLTLADYVQLPLVNIKNICKFIGVLCTSLTYGVGVRI